MPKVLSDEFLNSIVSKRFHKLIVIEYLGRKKFSGITRPYYKVRCDCGLEFDIKYNALQSLNTKSCGSCEKEHHGLSNTETYRVWQSIKTRCLNGAAGKFERYGGRGVTIDKSWLNSFSNFLKDMGVRPSENHTIERVDVNGNYCKENCIWTDDLSLQAFNISVKTNNTSGRTGVYLLGDSWVAQINFKNSRIYLGSFKSFEEACKAREEAELKYYGFIKE